MPLVRSIVSMKKASTETPWFDSSDAYKAHLTTNYIETGVILKRTVQKTGDDLSKTTYTMFRSKEDMTAYSADPMVAEVAAARNQYCANNNIKLNVIIQYLNDAGTIENTVVVDTP